MIVNYTLNTIIYIILSVLFSIVNFYKNKKENLFKIFILKKILLNFYLIYFGCIINSVDGIKKFYHHYFLIKKS